MKSEDKLRILYHTDKIAYWKQAYDDHTIALILQKPFDRDYLLTYYIVPYIEDRLVSVAMQRNGLPVGVEITGNPVRKAMCNSRTAAVQIENYIVRKGYLIMYDDPQSPIKLNHRRIRKGLNIRGYDDNYDYYLERQEKPVKEITSTQE